MCVVAAVPSIALGVIIRGAGAGWGRAQAVVSVGGAHQAAPGRKRRTSLRVKVSEVGGCTVDGGRFWNWV